MLSNEQIKQVEHSYSHSDCLVFSVGEKVYVAESCLKHRKESTIEMVECAEIDESCFSPDGEYYGDVTSSPLKTIILDDPCANNEHCVASKYYEDEIRSEVECH